jgi:hypothetical protein
MSIENIETPAGRPASTSGAAALAYQPPPPPEDTRPYPERFAEQQKNAREAAAREATEKLSPTERRRQELMNSPDGIYSKDPVKQKAAMVEMRKLLVALETPEERDALTDARLEDHRARYGLSVPDESVMPKSYQAEYEQEYSGHEQDFLVAARQHGLDSKLVGELRDAGIRMAIEAEGRAVSDEAWGALQKRFSGRLTAGQFESLKRWWHASVERAS